MQLTNFDVHMLKGRLSVYQVLFLSFFPQWRKLAMTPECGFYRGKVFSEPSFLIRLSIDLYMIYSTRSLCHSHPLSLCHHYRHKRCKSDLLLALRLQSPCSSRVGIRSSSNPSNYPSLPHSAFHRPAEPAADAMVLNTSKTFCVQSMG